MVAFEVMVVKSANYLIDHSDFLGQTLELFYTILPVRLLLDSWVTHQVRLKLFEDFYHLSFVYSVGLLHVSNIAN